MKGEGARFIDFNMATIPSQVEWIGRIPNITISSCIIASLLNEELFLPFSEAVAILDIYHYSPVFHYSEVTIVSIFQGLCFKLRKLVPCAICHIEFDIDLPEEDQIQVK